MDNFNDLGLDDMPKNLQKSRKPFLGVLKTDNLTKIYSQATEGDSENNLDAILEKISNRGMESLTTMEKELLKNFSKQN
jgi:hypothetical protein